MLQQRRLGPEVPRGSIEQSGCEAALLQRQRLAEHRQRYAQTREACDVRMFLVLLASHFDIFRPFLTIVGSALCASSARIAVPAAYRAQRYLRRQLAHAPQAQTGLHQIGYFTTKGLPFLQVMVAVCRTESSPSARCLDSNLHGFRIVSQLR